MEHSKSILPLALSDQLESGQKISFTKEKEEIDSKIKEANELVEKAQVIATPKHTKEEAKRIGEVKEGYRIKARRWLIISVGLALFLLGASWMGWGPFGFQPPENNRAQLWNLFSTKAIFFTLSIGALYVCVRNYLAMQHNYVVNEHREEALLTYEQMQNLAGIKDARDIILTLVASSIYSAQDTGFTKSEVGGTQSQLPVINQVLAAVRQKTLKDD